MKMSLVDEGYASKTCGGCRNKGEKVKRSLMANADSNAASNIARKLGYKLKMPGESKHLC